jgi:hypothetical protein
MFSNVLVFTNLTAKRSTGRCQVFNFLQYFIQLATPFDNIIHNFLHLEVYFVNSFHIVKNDVIWIFKKKNPAQETFKSAKKMRTKTTISIKNYWRIIITVAFNESYRCTCVLKWNWEQFFRASVWKLQTLSHCVVSVCHLRFFN